MKKRLFLFFAFCIFLSAFSLPAGAYSYEDPAEPELWMEPDFSTDHAYSIALVGDTQCLSRGDYFQGTNKMKQLFSVIADTAEDRKLSHVFVLGDITDMSYRNDANLGYGVFDPPLTGEWENAQKAILQLSKANISYSLCRGNHDDYMIDDYFNIPAYTDQFQGVGGFFSDSSAKHASGKEMRNPDGYVYWSAATGYHENSIVNSYKTMEICGNKYLFITVDHHLTMNVIRWVDQILEEYSDHLAIVAVHAYINYEGDLFSTTEGTTSLPNGLASEHLWEFALKDHKNVLAVVCGHVPTKKPICSNVRRGTYGNLVREILVNPQGYDLREEDAEGGVISGVQDTGMVLYMYFSQDGSKVTFDYYSTLLNKEMVGTDYPITLYRESPATKTTAKSTQANADVKSSEETRDELQFVGQNALLPALIIGAAVIALLVPLILFWRKKKR